MPTNRRQIDPDDADYAHHRTLSNVEIPPRDWSHPTPCPAFSGFKAMVVASCLFGVPLLLGAAGALWRENSLTVQRQNEIAIQAATLATRMDAFGSSQVTIIENQAVIKNGQLRIEQALQNLYRITPAGP